MNKAMQFGTKTVHAQQSLVDSKLKPDGEMHVLVGGPYTTSKGIEHRYGHTALRVKSKKSDLTYDFGRYSDTGGLFGESGDGILRKWLSFAAYIKSENTLNRKTTGFVYAIFQYQADAINTFFDKKIDGAKVLKGMSDPAKKTYQLKTDYYALGPNCTTLSIDGAKAAFPEFDKGSEKYIRPDEVLSFGERFALRTIGGASRLFLPANLKDFLLNGSPYKSVRTNSYGSGK